MKHSILAIMTFVFMACGASSDTGVNKSVFVGDGEHKSGGLRSVNGSVTVGNDATVDGSCSTVNGKIRIGENATVRDVSCVNGSINVDRNSKTEEISTVNGAITIGSEVEVDGNVSTVNGPIRSKIYTQIDGDLETVNGEMTVEQSMITGNITTVNGDIDLLDGSTVKGSIYVKRNRKSNRHKDFKELVITVDAKSKIKGNIEVKGDEPNVTVVLSGGGEVLGEVINARVIRK